MSTKSKFTVDNCWNLVSPLFTTRIIFVFTFWMLTKTKRTVHTMPSVPHTKMNENKEITPTKYTRNPPDHRHRRQITIFPQTLLPDFIRWSHAILMVPVLLAHMFVLSYQWFAKYSKIVDFIVTIYANGGCRTFLYFFEAYISQSLR